MISKDDCKIWVLFRLIQNFEISDLAMAKVKKVNIAFAYYPHDTAAGKWL
jgi:hypothetical protein